MSSLFCTVKSSTSDAAVGELLNEVCSPSFSSDNVCAGIATDATTGEYGSYSMCTGQQQLAFAVNAFYLSQTSAAQKAQACDFAGNATTQTPTKATGDCVSLLAEAGTAGVGSVTPNPTAGSGSSGTAGSASGSGSKGAASGNFVPGLGSGWPTFISVAVYISGAAAVGMGMIWI